MSIVIPVCVFLGGLLGTFLLQRAMSTDRRDWQRRMRSLKDQVAGFEENQITEETTKSPLPLLEKWLGESKLLHYITRRLTAAGLNLTPQEFFAFVIMTGVFFFAAGAIVSRRFGLSLVLGISGSFVPFLLLGFLRNRRKILLERQLADALILISSSMQAGYGFMQGVRVASEQLPSPICDEFERVAFNIGLGMSLQMALHGLGDRVQSYEFDLMISAVTTQIESGGSITNILENIAETIRSRNALRDEIRAMTAQGKLSGILLSMLPIGLLIGLSFLNRSYANLLYHDRAGQNILKGAFGLEILGWGLIKKILNVRL